MKSLPTRGAWIETLVSSEYNPVLSSRSPHGGRGLKLKAIEKEINSPKVAPHTGGVD